MRSFSAFKFQLFTLNHSSNSDAPFDLRPLTSDLRGLRVCFLAGTLGQGGAERQLFYMLKCLKECGAAVNLLTLTQDEYWEAPIRELGVPLHFVGDSPSRLARLLKITKTVGRLKPDFVQSQHFYTNIYSAISGRFSKRPSIGAVRNNVSSEINDSGAVLGRLSIALPSLLAANSQGAIDMLSEFGWRPSRFFFLPNVIDTERFQPGPQHPPQPYTILGIGRLVPQKRFDRFIRVAQRAAVSLKQPVRVWIAGEGPERPALLHLIEHATGPKLEISLLGRVADPLYLYQTADVFLLTSDHEGTPNVVMEALACGLPVVATKVGDVPELVQHGFNGYLFDPSDESAMTDALVRLADPDLRSSMRRKCRAGLEAGHALDQLPVFLAQLYAHARS